jgi:hypothetical protein
VIQKSVRYIAKRMPQQYYRTPGQRVAYQRAEGARKQKGYKNASYNGGSYGQRSRHSADFELANVLGSNDYYIWDKGVIATMTKHPKRDKGLAQFLVPKNRRNMYTKKNIKIRRADSQDLQVGKKVVILRDIFHKSGKMFLAPKNRQHAYNSSGWMHGKILNTDFAEEGMVMVGTRRGALQVSTKNLWVKGKRKPAAEEEAPL